jgi:hypothetical protein
MNRTTHLILDINDRRFELTGWKASVVSAACIGLFWLIVGAGIWSIGRFIAGLLAP